MSPDWQVFSFVYYIIIFGFNLFQHYYLDITFQIFTILFFLLRIHNDDSIPEMRVWFIMLKWHIHLNRSLVCWCITTCSTAHLCAVTYMTEISLNVTLNNQIHLTSPHYVFESQSFSLNALIQNSDITVDGLIFVGYQFPWFSWRVQSKNSSTHKIAIFCINYNGKFQGHEFWTQRMCLFWQIHKNWYPRK